MHPYVGASWCNDASNVVAFQLLAVPVPRIVQHSLQSGDILLMLYHHALFFHAAKTVKIPQRPLLRVLRSFRYSEIIERSGGVMKKSHSPLQLLLTWLTADVLQKICYRFLHCHNIPRRISNIRRQICRRGIPTHNISSPRKLLIWHHRSHNTTLLKHVNNIKLIKSIYRQALRDSLPRLR